MRVTLLQVKPATPSGPPGGGKNGEQYQAQMIDQSGRGMRLLVPFEVGPGTTIKIETDDSMMLAEICHSNRVNEERFSVGVQISQSLKFTRQLQQLCDTLAAAAGGSSNSKKQPAKAGRNLQPASR